MKKNTKVTFSRSFSILAAAALSMTLIGGQTFPAYAENSSGIESGAVIPDFLKDVLMQNGVPEEAILKEDQATYTYENAIYSRQVTDREYLDIKKAILCCKTCHARRALMYYKLLYPDTEFFVSSCCVDSIDKNTWIMTNDGIDEVMREITRIIKQFSLMLKKN